MSYWNHFGQKAHHGRSSETMRILISGGFGFVGGRLAVNLALSGHHIVLGSSKPDRLAPWLPQAELAQMVWDDGGALEHICCGVDVVIHAAGMNAQDCAADPVAALALNGVATARFVAAASRAGVKKFIYLSTAHVYASPLLGIITEGTCPRNLHPYATSHLAGEHAVLGARHRGQIQGIVLRLSNAFGAPVHKDVNCWMLLVNDLCRQAVQTRKLVLHTSGLQQRDFVSLDWICYVVSNIAVMNDASSNLCILNLGAGVSQSVIEIARLIQQRCKESLGFEPILHRPVDGTNEQPSALNYGVDKLTKIGLKISDDTKTMEVDNLLHYCRATFAQMRGL